MEKKINFWETKEWIEAKTNVLKTDKVLSRVEYLRLVGHENFSDQKYREYLKNMTGQPNDQK